MKKELLPPPTMEKSICAGIATVIAYGKIKKGGENYDWSLRLQQEEKYQLARDVMLHHARNKTLWAPKPIDHNGLVVCPTKTAFSEIDVNTEGIVIRRGIHADGVVLHSVLDAFLMTPADCATVVLSYRDAYGHQKVIAMHASRESLIDTSRFTSKQNRRGHEGVVESAFAHIPKQEIPSVQAWVGISVSPGEHFAHRTLDRGNPHNELLVGYIREKYGNECFADDGNQGIEGWLDTRMLVKKQLMLLGVPENHIEIDDTCTYSEKGVSGDHRWYSHIRGVEEKTGPLRNLVLVVRNH